MATVILPTRSIVSKPIIEDLIAEVAPDLEHSEYGAFRRICTALQASADSVAAACRDIGRLPAVIAEERQRVAAFGTACVLAFDQFIENMNIDD
jgi:hypothetical protein